MNVRCARLGQAQAALAEARAGKLSGELVEAAEVEALWTRKMRAFRNRVLAIPVRDDPSDKAERDTDAGASGCAHRVCG